MPGGSLPVIGKFVANAPMIFSGGLLAGAPAEQTSTDPNQMPHSTGDQTEKGGGDMCDFFLQHMWKNEDGIPVLGSMSHFLTYHTDPSYKNLMLSLASGAIGNSQMPVVNIYQGPLGWIPIFNPTHVRGHGTDYVTLLTGCGGMGLPIDVKTGRLNLDRLPTPEKVMNLAQRVMPNVPSLPKLLGSDYLYNTLRVDEVTKRLGFNTVMTPDEYLQFAGKNFDVFRTLATTVFSKMNDPVSILDVLKITDNLQTLQSLGLPGLPGTSGSTLTSGLPTGGLTAGLPTAGLFSGLPTSQIPTVGPLVADLLGAQNNVPVQTVTIKGKQYTVAPNDTVTVNGMPYPVTDGKVTIDGVSYPVKTSTSSSTPGSSTPGSSTPGSSTPGSSTPGSSTPGSSPLGSLTSSLPILGSTTGDPNSSSPLSGLTSALPVNQLTGPISGGSQGGLLPSSGSLPGADLLSSLPVVGGVLSSATGQPVESVTPGSSTPGSTTPGSTTPGSTTPGSTTPGSTTPGSTTPGSTTPGSTTPGSTTPGSTTPGSTTPGSTTPGSTTPGSTTPGGSTQTSGSLPGLGSLGSLPVVGSVLGGSSAPATTPQPGTQQPGTQQPGTQQPGTQQPGSPQGGTPAGTTPSTTTPGSVTPAPEPNPAPAPEPAPAPAPAPTPAPAQQGKVAFTIGQTTVNGGSSGISVQKGSSVTFRVPVTNTGNLPLTHLSGITSDGGHMTTPVGAVQPGQTAYLTYTVPAGTGLNSVGFNIVASNENGQQMAKTCAASYTGEAPAAGKIAAGSSVSVNGQAANPVVRYTFHSTAPAKVAFQVTNTGNAPIRTLTATSPNGSVSCAKSSLQPGESTTCTVGIAPQSGQNRVKVDFTGVDVNGNTTTSTKSLDYTLCTCGGSDAAPGA
ncbi:hypothetical protein GCM10027076_17550 [Nocardioides montaniterrae]